ncbi:MAG: hypoxanthine phosphoribosyltransferase [Syntrophorhabdaceae bacterium]|nr:hypoxanthine phosphoribosyltransferase [Syntrophorhabdaceae bacterium]MDD5244654.1 hypoxanthine phosphoribosyltransferase [Syntrophorhabdaceae bacterium]
MMKKLFSKEDIEGAVKRLASLIEKDFEGEDIVFVCLLKGSFMFTSDLVRCIGNPSRVDFMRVSSYGNAMKSRGEISVTKDLEEDIKDRNVVIVEDIIDSGLTLKSVREILKKREPKTLKICALVDKRARREVEIEGDYIGFTIDDGFIVGYGIDYAELYRNYPEIYVVEENKETG